jgi:hypothetical protein
MFEATTTVFREPSIRDVGVRLSGMFEELSTEFQGLTVYQGCSYRLLGMLVSVYQGCALPSIKDADTAQSLIRQGFQNP